MRGELANLHNTGQKKKNNEQKRKMFCTILMKFIVCSCGHPTCRCNILCYPHSYKHIYVHTDTQNLTASHTRSRKLIPRQTKATHWAL